MSGASEVVLREKRRPKQRIRILDILRGASLVSMIAYHAMFDLVYMFGLSAPWYPQTPGYLWQQSICWVFILVSGASMHYGRHPLRRGLLVFGCGMVLTVVTLFAMPGQTIWFGVLHFMGLAMLIMGSARRWLQKLPPLAGLLISFAIFLFIKGLPYGYLGVGDVPLIALPGALYSTAFLFPLGLPGAGFSSGDYFPMLPWLFLFLAGWYGFALCKGKMKMSPGGKNPIEWMGRHSLLIYMLHQPVVLGVLLLLEAAGVL